MKKAKRRSEKIKYGTVSLPIPLIEKVQKRIQGTGMPSVSAFVAFILRQILSSPNPNDKTNLIEKGEEAELAKRLKVLGY
ncbi:CopG family transcriptional regulator [Candidatus Pacearchaeota archaeon]|nr:CopG family transcriptional regulator [Candidatus Pacearchaeota archaeon]